MDRLVNERVWGRGVAQPWGIGMHLNVPANSEKTPQRIKQPDFLEKSGCFASTSGAGLPLQPRHHHAANHQPLGKEEGGQGGNHHQERHRHHEGNLRVIQLTEKADPERQCIFLGVGQEEQRAVKIIPEIGLQQL